MQPSCARLFANSQSRLTIQPSQVQQYRPFRKGAGWCIAKLVIAPGGPRAITTARNPRRGVRDVDWPPGASGHHTLEHWGTSLGTAAATRGLLYIAHRAQQITALPHAIMHHIQPYIKQHGLDTHFTSLLRNYSACVVGCNYDVHCA